MSLFFSSDLAAELPFTLMHPKPEEEPPCALGALASNGNAENDNLEIVPVDNLIQL